MIIYEFKTEYKADFENSYLAIRGEGVCYERKL